MTALALRADQDFWDDRQLAALRQLGVDEASNGDLAVFLHQSMKTGLDPFSRQIYMIGRNSKNQRTQQWEKKWTIQASIDGLRIVAQRTGEYAGQAGPLWCGKDGEWTDVWLDSEPPAAAKVGVYRTGFVEPLWGVARWESYVQTDKAGNTTAMWARMPDVMLAKCAEALALRKAFPQDLSGIYSDDEMSNADPKREPTHAQLVARTLDDPKKAERGGPTEDDPWTVPEWVVEWRAELAKATEQTHLDECWVNLAAAVASENVSQEQAAVLRDELAVKASELKPSEVDGQVDLITGEVVDAEVVEGSWPEVAPVPEASS